MRRFLPIVFVAFGLLVLGRVGWSAEAAAPSLPAATDTAVQKKADAGSDSAFTERLKAIRLLEIRYLRGNDEKQFQKGRQEILAIQDEAAIGPMVQVLYGADNARYRGLLIEALGEFAKRNSKIAQAYLQEIAVGDGNVSHRRRAVENLKVWTGSKPTERLLAHLALDEVPAFRDRAATALAALLEKQAVWLLVERLTTEEMRVTGGEVYDAQIQMDIRAQSCDVPTFKHSVISAAVPALGIATATIDLPEVRVIDVATTIAMPDKRFIPNVERVEVQHPEVLAALRNLTGKDFGYSKAAWQRWLQSEDASKTIPPWQPLVLKSQ